MANIAVKICKRDKHLTNIEYIWLSFHGVGGPKLRKWYGAPGLDKEDDSIMEEVDTSSGNLLELSNKNILFHLWTKRFALFFETQKKMKLGMQFW